MKIQVVLYSEFVQDQYAQSDFYKEALQFNSIIPYDFLTNEIDIKNLSDEFIEKTIDKHIENTQAENYEFDLVGIDGGLRIEYENEIIEHQCCSELKNYENWRSLLNNQFENWTEIWIGHPAIFYRINSDKIELSQYYDTLPEDGNVKLKLSINKNIFFKKLKTAIGEIEEFKIKVCRIIDNGNYENKEILKKVLL